MGLQLSTKYTITGGDGTRIVFNDPTDLDFVGRLDPEDGITGLDSPEIRESGDVLTEADGGIQGNNYFGRRPITMKGIIEPAGPLVTNQRIDKLQRCINRCLRADGTLRWTEDGSQERIVFFRTQVPTRISARRPKTFFIGLVSKDAALQSSSVNSLVIPAVGTVTLGGISFPMGFPLNFGGGSGIGNGSVVNLGNYEAAPDFRVDGPITNPVIANASTGEELRISYTLTAGQWLSLSSRDKTILLNGVQDEYSALDFLNSSWWSLQPGSNDVRLRGQAYSNPAALTVAWRHAYI